MFINEPKTFHDSIKPLSYFNFLIGMGIHWQSDATDFVYFCMQFYTVVSNFVNWILTYNGMAVIASYLNPSIASDLNHRMFLILLYTNSCIVVIAPILILLRRKDFMDCMRLMANLDDTFKSVLGVRNEYRKQHIRLICQVLGIILLMFVITVRGSAHIFSKKLSPLTNYGVLMILFHPIIIMLILDVNFCTFLGYLGKKFRNLNDGLMELAAKPTSTSFAGDRLFVISRNVAKIRPSNKANNRKFGSLINDENYTLHEIRKVHSKLCGLSRKINLAFGIQNLISVGISVTMLIGLSYTVYSAFSDECSTIEWVRNNESVLIWIIIYAFKIWITSHTCWRVSSEAQRTGEVIYDLLEQRIDEKLKKDIQGFAVQILQNPVRFNACGFFTLDYTFIQSVVGSITTYLVILIQMGNVPGSSTLKFLMNSTKI